MRFNAVSNASKVLIMGKAARHWLSPGQHGKVIAAVNHANYLLTEAGGLVWLATPDSPKHRRCLQFPVPLPRLEVDSTFLVKGRSIDLEGGTILDFGSLHVWETSALPVAKVIPIEQLHSKLFALFGLIHTMEKPDGYGSFIPPILRIANEPESFTGFRPENWLDIAAWPFVERITRACLSHDLPLVLKLGEALIGLGEGLTPSGDDFLGGLFFARYLLACAYPNLSYLKSSNLFKWIGTLQACTNLISFVLLKDNVAGHALDPLNRFGLALLTNQPEESASSAALDLIRVGHSTGWSLLAGFLVGMMFAFSV